MFRAVIVAISSCIQKNARVQIEMDRDTEPRPSKRVKPNTPDSDSSKSISPDNVAGGNDSVPSLQSPSVSFDSTVATLKDEEGLVTSSVRKEFEDIAVYATDRLVKYAQKKSGEKRGNVCISFNVFQDWRRAEGARIAPWLDLLNLARWKTPQRPTERSTTTHSQQTSNASLQQQKQGPQPLLPPLQRQALESKEPIEPSAPKLQSPTKLSPLKNAHSQASKLREPVSERDETAPLAVPSLPINNQTPLYKSDNSSRTVLSFDFSGSGPRDDTDDSFCITITEENLITFRNLVRTTGLIHRSCNDVTTILFEASKTREDEGTHKKIVPVERFHTCLHQLLGSGSVRRLSKIDKDIFSSCFVDFFTCFNTGLPPLQMGEAFAQELAVGFCFLCAGNKSSKLASGFELLESQRGKGLTNEQLVHFLRSYLTMLVGISLLTSSLDGVMKPKLNARTRKAMHSAVDNGARWTLRHFLKNSGLDEDNSYAVHSFEAFASWYSTGGFNVAPWLELLDLKKLLSLVGEDESGPQSPALSHDRVPSFPGPDTMSPEFASPRHKASQQCLTHASSSHSQHLHPPISSGAASTPFGYPHPPPPAEVLFTFPLANQCSLVVLREDASYVRGVVDQLSLLSFPPEEVWSTLFEVALSRPPVPPAIGAKLPKSGSSSKTMLVDKATFVECMQETIQKKGVTSKKRSSSGVSRSLSGSRDVLTNFFQSFDLLQIDRVALNELMGGLTLLCGGKKSTKLAFAFSVFDRRQNSAKRRGKKTPSMPTSLDGEELFLFLRSFLIVMFSCCRQSWDLTDDAVNRYIADTANMVTDDVMRYQWRSRKKERIDFDEFGQWYNEGGYETAPWLELLDLRKWVLVENFEILERQRALDSPGAGLRSGGSVQDPDCPPPPPDADVDPSFFDDDANGIMPMDSMDEMDLLLMQQPSSHEKEDRVLSKLAHSFPFSPKPSPESNPPPRSNSLKFHVVTDDNHGGYIVSLSQKRIRHFRHILMESGLHQIDGEEACREILAQACRDSKSRSRSSHYVLTKEDFDSAMRRVIASRSMSVDTQRALSDILNEIFFAFDYDGIGRADAFDVACGFTVLCQGKKSDKLEYAFEILDWAKRGFLSRADTTRYLRSFLTVLLNIVSTDALDSDFVDDVMTTMNGEKCDKSIMTMGQVVDLGCQWASDQAMTSSDGNRESITFDDFAEWYTRVGYSNIPWLELLDLNKWVVLSESSAG